jgi:hypothetical protein
MKKLYSNSIVLALMLLISACSRDGGAYDPPVIVKDFNGTTYEYLKSKPGIYDSLLLVVDRLGDVSLLKDSNVTLFAPTNQSFQVALTNLNNLYALSQKPAKSYGTISLVQLDTMMTQYIIKGSYPTDSLLQQDGLSLRSVKFNYPMHAKVLRAPASGFIGGGPEYIEISDTKRSQFTRDWVNASTASINIKTTNGIVHVLTADHVFGFEDFISRLTFNPPPPNLFSLVGGKQSTTHESDSGASGVEGSNNLIDGNPETKIFLNWDPKTVTFTYEFVVPVIGGAYTITSANDADDRDPADWNIQASTDGERWVTLDTEANQVFDSRFEQKVFFFQNRVAYKFYRLTITRNNGSDGMQFADWTINLAK